MSAVTRRDRTRRFVAIAVVAACGVVGFVGARALRSGAGRALLESSRLPDVARHDTAIAAAAAEARVDADLVRGLVAAESGGDPRARSGAGAVGLLQLLPTTAAEQAKALGVDPATMDLTDPTTNLRLGARYLRRLLDLFEGQESFAIAAYNAGPEPVKRWRLRAVDASPADVIRREAYAETRTHVERVLRYRDQYRSR